MEMCKQNESRIEELMMENAKLRSQLSAVDRTSQSYDVREYICAHIQMDTEAIVYHVV